MQKWRNSIANTMELRPFCILNHQTYIKGGDAEHNYASLLKGSVILS